MIKIKRIIQFIIGIGLLIAVIFSFRYNNIGQNIINTLAAFVFISGLENIIIFYSVYIE